MVVTKTFPASDVRLLAELGVTDVAENKQQELSAKRLELRESWPTCRCAGTSSGSSRATRPGAVADAADVVHSVDRAKLLGPMDRRARALDVLLQVSLDPPGSEHRPARHPRTWARWRTRSSPPSTSRCAG